MAYVYMLGNDKWGRIPALTVGILGVGRIGAFATNPQYGRNNIHASNLGLFKIKNIH